MPGGFIKTLFDPAITWQFKTEPSEGTAGRRISTTQGRTLGGSSSINGMIFVRGQAADYDSWAQRGNRGWSYDDVLPYFRRLERRISEEADEHHRGRDGPLPVTDTDWRHPLCDAFIAGAQSLGFPRNPDYNGATQEGVSYTQRAIHRARRVNAADAYLRPLMRREGLRVITDAQVTAIALEGRRARGVTYRRAGQAAPEEVQARKEVILTAGGINSPKLLQLSGIGDPALLQKVGVPLRHALSGVGENLADHYSPRIVVRARGVETINSMVRGPKLLWQLAMWGMRRPSVLGLSAVVVYAFARSDPALEHPDYTVTFMPASFREGVLGRLDTYPGMTCGVWQLRPESTGYVHIRSSDPLADPIIQPNYLAREKDGRVLLAGIRMARRILGSPPLAAYCDAEQLPGSHVTSDADLLQFARQYGNSIYHPCGACRMGPDTDPMAAVDDELRVHGLEGLRVADSSVMPAIVSANTYATTLMIAEKASDLLLGRRAV